MPTNPLMALGAGVISSVAVSSLVVGSTLALPLFYFASLPLYLTGLGAGSKGLLIALIAAVVTAGVIGGVIAAVPFALAYALPVWLACRNALMQRTSEDGTPEWYPVGYIAAWITVLAAVLMGVGTLYAGETTIDGSLEQTVQAFLNHALGNMVGNMPADLRGEIVLALSQYFPGMAAASWVIMHIANAATAESVLCKSGKALRADPSYSNAYLPDWCSWALVVAAAITVFGDGDLGYIGQNLTILMLTPFFLVGLAVVHSMARRYQSRTLLLVAFYFTLLVIGWAVMAVAALGVIEQWVGLRNRFAATPDQETD